MGDVTSLTNAETFFGKKTGEAARNPQRGGDLEKRKEAQRK